MNKDAINRAVSALSIAEVYVRESTARLEPELEPIFSGTKLKTRFKARTVGHQVMSIGPADQRRNVVAYEIVADVQSFFADSEKIQAVSGSTSTVVEGQVLAASMRVVFCAVYRVVNSMPDEEALQEFGVNNALFHVWPYWREYLGSMCNRLHLKPIVLPMFRPPPMRGRESAEGDDASNSSPAAKSEGLMTEQGIK